MEIGDSIGDGLNQSLLCIEREREGGREGGREGREGREEEHKIKSLLTCIENAIN